MFHKLKRYFPHMLDWKFGKYRYIMIYTLRKPRIVEIKWEFLSGDQNKGRNHCSIFLGEAPIKIVKF
jgi:hypothetical protein